MRTRIMYVERKDRGVSHGEARIGRVSFSKSGRTIRYSGREFRSLDGAGYKANYYDVATGERYWISGCKGRGCDRLYCERVQIAIDADVWHEYWEDIRGWHAPVSPYGVYVRRQAGRLAESATTAAER